MALPSSSLNYKAEATSASRSVLGAARLHSEPDQGKAGATTSSRWTAKLRATDQTTGPNSAQAKKRRSLANEKIVVARDNAGINNFVIWVKRLSSVSMAICRTCIITIVQRLLGRWRVSSGGLGEHPKPASHDHLKGSSALLVDPAPDFCIKHD
jgi:hypothetical protein